MAVVTFNLLWLLSCFSFGIHCFLSLSCCLQSSDALLTTILLVCYFAHGSGDEILYEHITNFSVHVADGCGSVLLRQGDEIPRGRGNFGCLSGLFKSIGNLCCIQRSRVRCKSDHSIAITSCSRRDYSVCQASANSNLENSECRRCGVSAVKGVMGVYSAGEVLIALFHLSLLIPLFITLWLCCLFTRNAI